MTESFIDRAYSASGSEEMRTLYDEWASRYDQDVEASGYVTPGRVAEALANCCSERDKPILDFGCGTGLSGVALVDAGFTNIDGVDVSAEMLDVARNRGLYRDLRQIDVEGPLSIDRGDYEVITAVGVISVGGAPGSVYNEVLKIMAPGNLLVFSMNDESMKMPEYAGRLKASVEDKEVRVLSENYGPHVSKHGKNSGSTVYVLERLDSG